MSAIAGICLDAAVVASLLVPDRRTTAPRLAPPAPYRGCALPVLEVTS